MYSWLMMKQSEPDKLAGGAPKLNDQLCFALYSTSRAMSKTYRPLLAPLGLTYPQFLVMLVLWAGDRITVTELGDHLFLDSATLTPLLKRLQAAGLVTRTRTSEDEREVLIALTPAGVRLKSKANAVHSGIVRAAQCPAKELASIKTKLELLRANLLRNA